MGEVTLVQPRAASVFSFSSDVAKIDLPKHQSIEKFPQFSECRRAIGTSFAIFPIRRRRAAVLELAEHCKVLRTAEEAEMSTRPLLIGELEPFGKASDIAQAEQRYPIIGSLDATAEFAFLGTERGDSRRNDALVVLQLSDWLRFAFHDTDAGSIEL